MFSIIKKAFTYKHTLAICCLSLAAFLLLLLNYKTTSTSTYSLWPGNDITEAHYFSTTMIAYILFAAVFAYISYRSFKNLSKKISYGAICIAITHILMSIIVWKAGVLQLGDNTNTDQADIFLSYLSEAYILFSIIGSLLIGFGFKKIIDTKKDYFGILLIILSFLIFINATISILFVVSWILFELRSLDHTKELGK